MKLKITLEEARVLVLRSLNLPTDTEITITRGTATVIPEIRKLINDIESMDYQSSGKISAIKRFRVAADTGLAESKWVVENWDKVKSFMLKKRRFPIFTGAYHNGTLSLSMS